MYNKQDLINDYLALCDSFDKSTISRKEYREYGNYKTSLIEKLFGSWTNFVKEANDVTSFSRNRNERKTILPYDIKTVVVTSAIDGQPINRKFFDTLVHYCNENKAALCVLWSKSLKNITFSKADFALLDKYLSTEVVLPADSACLIKDFLISNNTKNPLTNLEKLTKYSTIITASSKQYMKILPYDVDDSTYRVAWSTGTISYINTSATINDILNNEYNTFGAIRLDYSDTFGKYITRNLVFDEETETIEDLNIAYNDTESCKVHVDGIVLGDLHLPEENKFYVKKSVELINQCLPSSVMIHDWCSFNSINHHTANRYLTKVLHTNEYNKTLEIELAESINRLTNIIDSCSQYTTFYLVHSNHDDFLMKWLNEGEFVKDKENAVIGCELFAKIAQGQHPFYNIIKPNNNLYYFLNDENYKIHNIEVGIHGHEGIAGAKGSTKSYSKLYTKSITGHTHSPQIFENHYVVGTNSNLKLPYTSKFTNWACCNAIIHTNGTIQLVFVD